MALQKQQVPSLPGVEFLDSVVQMPVLELPVRAAVLSLGTGRLLWSPGSTLSPAQLSSAGEVTDIVAPSLLHTAGMKGAAAHPSARLWGPFGCREKHPELRWHGVLGVDAWPHEAELSAVTIPAMPRVNETVFLHTATRTLFVADLAFNIEDPKGLGAFIVYSVFGTYRRFGVSRLFLKYAKDRAAVGAAISKLAHLGFDNLVPSHGSAVMGGASKKLLGAARLRGLQV